MTRMIITDLDKTLLRSDNYISDYTISILKKCRAKGIKIAYATARSTKSASKFLNQFKPDIFIGYGGALVCVGDEVIYRSDIPANVSAKLINECLQEPEIISILAINESAALTNRKEVLNSESMHYKYTDFSSNYSQSYLKISLVSANPNVVNRIASNYPMCNLLRYTGENIYRFANLKALKWNAVIAVAEYFNADTDMFTAFGDDVNDLEMIKNCGTGVAVENAINDVKAVAKHICGTNDNDGVAKWIENNIL